MDPCCVCESHADWLKFDELSNRDQVCKLPYIGHFSFVAQKKIRHFIKRYCNDLDIKLVFSSFKIGNLLGVKDPIPGGLRSRVVCSFLHLSVQFLDIC